MKTAMLCAALLAGACLAAPAGADPRGQQERVAYFQTHTIFHSGLRDIHTVAFTFDDGPNANTNAVLDVLKQYNVKATFFVVGALALQHPATVRRIVEEGHALGNHTFTHP
ncbi:MAG: polysaccharide deacetylase family protein, partial [Alphaproteobacteria bacterium]|nr:polysaccharide deacetylase family protein [Alphaproteobacteria bacterium]